MKLTPRNDRTQPDDEPAKPVAPRDDALARDRQRERKWRIGATQAAAPSTRRWRRAGRFGSED